MHDTAMVPRRPDGDPPGRRPLVDEDLADQLPGKARAEGVELLGPDGLLSTGRDNDPSGLLDGIPVRLSCSGIG